MSTTIELKNQWRWFLTGTGGEGITFLDRLARNVEVSYVLGAPAQASGDLPSDNPEVNIPATDGDPFVSFNNRLLYGLRREGGVIPYVCRFAGVMQMLEDEAASDEPVTHWTAYDPWMWLNSIPVVTAAGDLLGKDGLSYTGTRGDVIAKALLTNAMAVVVAENPTNPIYIDEASGHYDATDAIDITFPQGISVGEAWTQLVDTGSLDILLTPIYDPSTRPGKLAVLNVYQQAGSPKNNAIFAWDKMPHSLVEIDRLDDGTQMANVGQFYTNGAAVAQETNAPSIAKYGQWWLQRSFPPPSAASAVALIAAAQVALRRQGKRTVTFTPAPERAPDPFTEYYLGDTVPVYAGRPQAGGGVSFRAPLTPGGVVAGEWENPQRVYGIPIALDDNQVETVQELLLTDSNAP